MRGVPGVAAVEPAQKAAQLDSAPEHINSMSLAATEKTDTPADPAAAVQAPAHAFPLGRWTMPKNPFATKLAKNKQDNGPALPQLSIEAVRVVRNDLIDADLELVPRQPQPASTPASPAVKRATGHESFALVWGRITARILGVGRTH